MPPNIENLLSSMLHKPEVVQCLVDAAGTILCCHVDPADREPRHCERFHRQAFADRRPHNKAKPRPSTGVLSNVLRGSRFPAAAKVMASTPY